MNGGVWTKHGYDIITVNITAQAYDAMQARLVERKGSWMNDDSRIAALVEVGAIPYRERYQPRHTD